MTDTHTGIHEGIGFDVYSDVDRMNASTLVMGFKSMLSLKRAIDGDKPEETAAMRFGQQYHTVILEPDRFAETHVVMPDYKSHPDNVKADGKRSYRKTTWVDDRETEFLKQNKGKAIIDQKQYDRTMRMIESLQTSKVAMDIIQSHRREVTVYGEIEGVPCKGRIDLLGETITDLKGCADATPFAFGTMACRLRYPEKLSFYRELVRQTTGKTLPVFIIAVETDGDFDRVVYPMGEAELDAGFSRMCRLLREYKDAKDQDCWTGVDKGAATVPFVTPNWAMPEDDGLEW